MSCTYIKMHKNQFKIQTTIRLLQYSLFRYFLLYFPKRKWLISNPDLFKQEDQIEKVDLNRRDQFSLKKVSISRTLEHASPVNSLDQWWANPRRFKSKCFWSVMGCLGPRLLAGWYHVSRSHQLTSGLGLIRSLLALEQASPVKTFEVWTGRLSH